MKMDTASGVRASRLGASLRDRATLPSPLRGLDPFGRVSLAPPFASLTARSACPAARCAPRRVPCRQFRSRRAPATSPSCHVLALGASRNARRVASLARAARLRCPARRRRTPCVAGAGFAVHRAAHRAAQSVPAQVRTPPADASGSALRATAFGAGRSARHSSAVAAPLRRLRRRRFPQRSAARSVPFHTPCGGLVSHTRRISDAGCGIDDHVRDMLRLTMTVRTGARS